MSVRIPEEGRLPTLMGLQNAVLEQNVQLLEHIDRAATHRTPSHS